MLFPFSAIRLLFGFIRLGLIAIGMNIELAEQDFSSPTLARGEEKLQTAQTAVIYHANARWRVWAFLLLLVISPE